MEVIVAIFFIATGIIGSYILINSTIFSTTHASNKFTATYLAQEGIEIVRNIRDTNWLENPVAPFDAGLNDCAGNCTGDDNEGCIADYTVPLFWGVNADLSDPSSPNITGPFTNNKLLKLDPFVGYSYLLGNDTKFRRQINITPLINPPRLAICVWVGWEERGFDHIVTVSENLYDWR